MKVKITLSFTVDSDDYECTKSDSQSTIVALSELASAMVEGNADFPDKIQIEVEPEK